MKYGTIGSLWVEWPLNKIAELCVRSWVRLGYHVLMYTYDDVESDDAPKIPGVTLRDARAVWAPPYMYKHERYDSWAPFSDVFRHRMIWEMPVLTWLDLDVALVKQLPDDPNMIGMQDVKMPAGCLIRAATNHTIRERLLDLATRTNTTYHVLPWGATGMLWYGQIVGDQPDVSVLPHAALTPVPSSKKHDLWMRDGIDVTRDPGIIGVHFFNAATRGVDPTRRPNSVYDQCWRMVEEAA